MPVAANLEVLFHLFPLILFISTPDNKFEFSLNGSCNFLIADKLVYLKFFNSVSMHLLILRTLSKCLPQTFKSYSS
jgi:hypothetical protein